MKPRTDSFDGLASAYERLERLALGSDLEAARFWHLNHLRNRRRVLVLGEGDGRFLARLVRRFPSVHVDCVEASGAMIARTRGRLTPQELGRVTFRHENALTARFETGAYDAIVTLFFLDCFTVQEVSALICRLTPSLRSDAIWLWSDFNLPAHGWQRWRAQVWLGVLYGFFRFQTRITARQLPPTVELLHGAGFVPSAEHSLQAGLLRCAVFQRTPSDS